MKHASARAGLSLLELLIVLSVLALSAAFVAMQWPSPLGPAAGALRNLVAQGRLEAVNRAEPVAVIYDTVAGEYQLRHLPGGGTHAQLCSEGQVLQRLQLQEYRGVSAGPFPGGLVWLPTGYGRTCQGGAVFNQTITLLRGDLQGRIIVSRAGRVRSEVEVR